MHVVDRAAGQLIRYGPRNLRFFTEGWGDPALVSLGERLHHLPQPEPIDIRWSPDGRVGADPIYVGRADGPTGNIDPRLGPLWLWMVRPRMAQRVTVLMAAWNDHGPVTRLKLAAHLAALGVASVIPENPLYGRRRVRADGQPIRTVADFMLMGHAAVTEGRALLRTLETNHAVGVSGYSMGGNIAALITATYPGRIASAPLAASHSPGPVYMEGVLRHGISLARFSRDDISELDRRLRAVTALAFDPVPATRTAVLVSARSDGFVPRSASLDLHRHWPGSEMRLLPGGHATAWWFRRRQLARGVIASFDRAGL